MPQLWPLSGQGADTANSSISANLNSLKAYGLSRDFISDVFYQGDGDYLVHAWIIKPSTFVEGQKYPLAFYIHGGPQGATEDLWSTRWNMAVFAEQGYGCLEFPQIRQGCGDKNIPDDGDASQNYQCFQSSHVENSL
ncbi:hypothetical protein PX690_21545 [Bacillus velezensis]|uniref:alpha/beta hydrolase family protein n=1 Tax=Bacillus velezensis TaxID=492670 RepID=UPI0023E2D4BF|nr:hypothetical protein [Bacillus velezensis]WES02053.1 hypothetical protein PX690_21545 [Bacillus velezensis]